MTRFLSFFTVQTPWTLAYMLQQVEYNPVKFIKWCLSFPNLLSLQKRGKLVPTARAKFMFLLAYGSWVLGFMLTSFLALWFNQPLIFLSLLLLPLLCVLAIFSASVCLQFLVVAPGQKREIAQAKRKLSKHDGAKIAVLGSYGKTTMKELLATVLSEGKKVAATPGNKNVLISHARWVNGQVDGDEDVLIFEYGEAEPGDIAKLAIFSEPSIAVVTGLAPAHLDVYPSLESVADDFATIQKFVGPESLYVNSASALLSEKIDGTYYHQQGVDGWKVSDVEVGFEGTSFILSKGKQKLQIKSGLLGEHQTGPLAAVAVIALKLGLSNKQVIQGVAATKSFEHRMQARHLHGAWILDDTYNGNIEGMRAGLELLKVLPGKRKIYVTPGLVDQGVETKSVHEQLGKLIANANPDQVVLMQNSVTEHIQEGLKQGDFKGELKLETKPLEYYTNLEHYLAAGDVVMLQNDWPDSYR